MLKTSRLALALAVLVLAAAPARSDEGEYTLNKDNWQKAEGLLPEPVLKRIKAGDYSFKVVPLDAQKFRENYSTSYWSASEANEGKYDLDADPSPLPWRLAARARGVRSALALPLRVNGTVIGVAH